MGATRMPIQERRDLIAKIDGYAEKHGVTLAVAAKHFGITGANYSYHRSVVLRVDRVAPPPAQSAPELEAVREKLESLPSRAQVVEAGPAGAVRVFVFEGSPDLVRQSMRTMFFD